MKLKHPIPFENGGRIIEFQCYKNNCFTMSILYENMIYHLLYNGPYVPPITLVLRSLEDISYQSALLEKSYHLLMITKKNFKTFGALYNANNQVVIANISDFEIFPNNWYSLKVDGVNRLYNANHELVATDFTKAEVFSIGYALHTDNLFKYHDWSLFTEDGNPLNWYKDIQSFHGDGNLLLKTPQGLIMKSFDDKEISDKLVSKVKDFANGRFAIRFTDNSMRMYQPDGSPLTIVTENAVFLPDGCCISDRSVDINLYRRDGLRDKTGIYHYEIAGDCYTLSTEKLQGELYDDESNKLGENFLRYAECGRFSLWEHENTIKLYCGNKQVISKEIL